MNDVDQWIMCIPVVGTAHITKQDHDLLESPNHLCSSDLLFASFEQGWIVRLSSMDHAGLTTAGFSVQFVNLLQIFFDAGYKFLRLDADGDVLNLPTSDW